MSQRILDQILHRTDAILVRELFIHDQHIGHRSHQRDGREITYRIVWNLAVKGGIDGVGSDRTHDQRVPVGLRLGDEIGTNIATRAGTIFNDDSLT